MDFTKLHYVVPTFFFKLTFMFELLNLFFCIYVVLVASILINTHVLRLHPH